MRKGYITDIQPTKFEGIVVSLKILSVPHTLYINQNQKQFCFSVKVLYKEAALKLITVTQHKSQILKYSGNEFILMEKLYTLFFGAVS